MPAKPSYQFDWIRTADELAQAAATLEREPFLSIDTETSGWQTGNEQLCLIQIGIPSTKRVLLVDVLATGAPTALGPLLVAPNPLIVAHNASFEERQFARYDLKVKGVRDTLAMSRELRPDLPNHTLRTCCRLLLGVEMSKEEQTSDWSIRPLSDRQIDYARLDAEVALTLYDYLNGLEERAKRDLDLDIPKLVEEYSSVVKGRFDLAASIAHEYAYLQARENKLREAIRQKLIDGSPAYDGPFGKASISKVKRTEVNPQRVREVFPEFAQEVIQEHVDRKRFDAVAKEHGLPKNSIEVVLDTVGYNDRLSLALKDESGVLE
jgi:DNA polymerase III epsilon subunit-like protein